MGFPMALEILNLEIVDGRRRDGHERNARQSSSVAARFTTEVSPPPCNSFPTNSGILYDEPSFLHVRQTSDSPFPSSCST